METKAYIVASGDVIAEVNTALKSGEIVRFSWVKTEERMNAARDWNLVNARHGKILRAEKWKKKFVAQAEAQQFGKEINPGDFFIY